MVGFSKRVDHWSRFGWEDKESNSEPGMSWVFNANGGTAYLDNVLRFGFKGSQKEPLHVTKISRILENAWMLEAEYSCLQTLWNCLGDLAPTMFPQPLDVEISERQAGLSLGYVPGRSLVDIRRSSFWEDPSTFTELALESAQVLRLIHDRSARSIQSQTEPAPGFQVYANRFAQLFDLTSEETSALEALVHEVDARSKIPFLEILLHGDFWHGNLIRGAEHGNLVVIDWQFGHWATDASFDVYLFLMAGALAAVPYGPVQDRAKAAAIQLEEWEHDLIPTYLEAYGQPEDWGLLPLLEGLLACCVEKAARSEIVFKTRHPDDVMWRTLFGELVWKATKSGSFS